MYKTNFLDNDVLLLSAILKFGGIIPLFPPGPPSSVQNLTLVFRDQTTVVVSWERPSDFGGRHDIEYRVECIGCTDKTHYEPRQAGFNTTRYVTKGLIITMY